MSSERLRVTHYGVVGESPGGMAQVVNEILAWPVPGVEQSAVATTRRRHDPLALPLSARAGLHLVSRSSRPDVAVFHLSERGSFLREGALLRLAKALRVPRVAHLHGADFAAFSRRYPTLVANVLRSASVIVVLTEESRSISKQLAPEVPVELLHNAVAVPQLSAVRSRNVIFCGELGVRKGADVLLESWGQIHHRAEGWTLQLVGPPHSSVSLAEVPPATEIVGPVQRSVALEMQSRSAIAVLPSRAEALPMFLIEAMARGCVPVSTRVGQIPELVDGVGYLVRPGSIDELADALLDAISLFDSDEAAMAAAAVARIENNYSARAIAPALGEVWSRAARLS